MADNDKIESGEEVSEELLVSVRLERIARAAERIADVLERREDARMRLDRDIRKVVRLAAEGGKDVDVQKIIAKVLSEDEPS